MFKNYVIIAFRNLWRNKLYSLINIFGLAIGIALSIMMFLYVYNELTYDNFHEFKDRIYIVELKNDNVNEGTSISAIATAGIGPSLLEEMPEVENMVRFSNHRPGFFSYNQKNYSVKNIIYSDSSVFDIFSFRLIKGNPKTALTEPFTIVLTEKTAEKIFGNNDPIGKIIKFNNKENLLINGIVENPPENSQIKFNALISFTTLYKMPNMFLGWDGGHSYYTYIKLNQNASIQQLYGKLPSFMEKHINYKYRQFGSVLSLIFEPLEKIHLYSKVSGDLPTSGNLNQIYILSGIAIFILLIACINFINLSTAMSIKRAKEVGLRKVVGATKGKIITQFLGESFLLSFISLIIALIIIEIIQPVFNSLVYSNLNLYDQSNITILVGLILITIISGLFAGSFPAFYISGFQPVTILKGGFNTIKGKPVLRKILIFVQFFITSILIVSTITFFLQLNFLKNKDLGFNKGNVILLGLTSETAQKKVDVLKNEFRKIPNVKNVAASTSYPGSGLTRNGYLPEGLENPIMIHVIDVDYDYLSLMDIKIINGRNFSKEFGTDQSAFLINETLAKKLNWENPTGKYISRDGKHKIIGVVKDFHFSPLHYDIEPLIITVHPWDYYYLLSLKVNPGDSEQTLKTIETAWNKIIPNEPFNYRFLDKAIESNYIDIDRTGETFIYFSLIAIILAGLGLFGQAVFNTEQRIKEIGIRKVLGANVKEILIVLTSDIAKIILVANIFAFPLAWYFNYKWLQHFAYHINVSYWVYITTLMISLTIAIITILFQTIKAARTSPLDALKYE